MKGKPQSGVSPRLKRKHRNKDSNWRTYPTCGTGSHVSAEWGLLRTSTIRHNPKLKKYYFTRATGQRVHLDFEQVCAAPILSRSCPLWVKSRHSTTAVQCPLHPQKQTSD